jgi:hypothetical protein
MKQLENLSPGKQLAYQQELWHAQRHYVVRNSDFYRKLWKGKKPPKNWPNLPA